MRSLQPPAPCPRVPPWLYFRSESLAIWAHKVGYTRAALVFASDTGSQTLYSPTFSTFARLGGHATISIKILPDQSSYRSEVKQVLDSHPQVIITELDPPIAILRQLSE